MHDPAFPLLAGHPDERLPSCDGYDGLRAWIIPYQNGPCRICMRTWAGLLATSIFSDSARQLRARASVSLLRLRRVSPECALRQAGTNQQFCLFDPHYSLLQVWRAGDIAAAPAETWRPLAARVSGWAFIHCHKDAAVAHPLLREISTLRFMPWLRAPHRSRRGINNGGARFCSIDELPADSLDCLLMNSAEVFRWASLQRQPAAQVCSAAALVQAPSACVETPR